MEDCCPDNSQASTIISMWVHLNTERYITKELDALKEMQMGMPYLAQLSIQSLKQRGFRNKSVSVPNAIERIKSVVYAEKEYLQYRIKRIHDFINCIEAMDVETTDLHRRYSKLELEFNITQGQLDDLIDEIELNPKKVVGLHNMAERIQSKLNTIFEKFTVEFTQLETGSREIAEGLIRVSFKVNETVTIGDIAKFMLHPKESDG